MNQTVRASKFLLIVAITSSAPLCLRASLYAQQGVGASVSEQPAVPIAATSDFEVKVVPHGFLARRKGSDEWLEVSKLSEPIVVGQLDSDHKVYIATKAIKPPKMKHSEDPKYPDSELL